QASPSGIADLVQQQFQIAAEILRHGLCPIIEPEVDIHCPDKAQAESLLKKELERGLSQLKDEDEVMFKLTLPEQDNLYADFVQHPQILKVVALSGGDSRQEANARLARQRGVVASFSRALSDGLSAQMSADDFDKMLDASIQSSYDASMMP